MVKENRLYQFSGSGIDPALVKLEARSNRARSKDCAWPNRTLQARTSIAFRCITFVFVDNLLSKYSGGYRIILSVITTSDLYLRSLACSSIHTRASLISSYPPVAASPISVSFSAVAPFRNSVFTRDPVTHWRRQKRLWLLPQQRSRAAMAMTKSIPPWPFSENTSASNLCSPNPTTTHVSPS